MAQNTRLCDQLVVSTGYQSSMAEVPELNGGGTRAQWRRHLRLAAPSSCAFLRFLPSADFSPSKTIPDKGFNQISLAQQCQGGRDILYVCFGCRHDTIPRFFGGGSKEERVKVLRRLLKK